MKNLLSLAALFCCVMLCTTACSDDPAPSGPVVRSIKGKVAFSTGAGIEGVIVSTGGKSDTTSSNGEYEIAGLEAKSYTVTPSSAGLTFTPANRTVDLASADAAAIDFSAASSVVVEMISVDPGTFTMGGIQGWSGGGADSRPQHSVTLTRGFMVGKYEVTQEQWIAVMGPDPLVPGDLNHPVYNINWFRMLEFCNKLSEMQGYEKVYTINGTTVQWNWNAHGYRLPVEAEWEFMARAGTTDNTYVGNFNLDNENGLNDVAWWRTGNPAQGGVEGTRAVGTKPPNPWGIYDVIGNVNEACLDPMRVYTSDAVTDPVGTPLGEHRIFRGGSWNSLRERASCTWRSIQVTTHASDQTGFRVVRTR